MTNEEKKEQTENMSRVNHILFHPYYQECLAKNQKAEEGRIFCGHDMVHFLNVARIAYIFSMERQSGIPKESVYAAALLHDIGKWQQYEFGIPHDKASAQIAEPILSEAGFERKEREMICAVILGHRSEGACEQVPGEAKMLAQILYDADKASRSCFSCEAKAECDWGQEKKNLQLMV
ncbi:HD domain-containing protein [Roseburia hominis]